MQTTPLVEIRLLRTSEHEAVADSHGVFARTCMRGWVWGARAAAAAAGCGRAGGGVFVDEKTDLQDHARGDLPQEVEHTRQPLLCAAY